MFNKFIKTIWLVPVTYLLVFFLTSCEDYRDTYFEVPERSDQTLYEALSDDPELSEFFTLMNQYGLDSIFEKDDPLTLFIPDNEAFSKIQDSAINIPRALAYHISHFIINIHEVDDYRKVQTHFNKFSTIINNDDQYYYDQALIKKEGGYYKDGTYYILNDLAYPNPSLYEYMNDICPPLASYVDYTDSVAFDPLLSNAVGFDSLGNTIYDSVFTIVNRFERDYFPVTKELREDMATLLLFKQEQYDAALDEMALNLGANYQTHEDIPVEWQNEVLLPYFMDNGVFAGIMEMEDFENRYVQNINGDTVTVDPDNIDPESRTLCSNGIAYNYLNFFIPEELYKSQVRFEGDELVIQSGENSYDWIEEVVTSDRSVSPELKSSAYASGGTYVAVNLERAQRKDYSIEFTIPRIFPNNYKLYWRAYYRPSGEITFYVNENKIGTFDNYNFRRPVDGINPEGNFNKKGFSLLVEEYGDIHVKMVYEDYGVSASNNGICLDYIELVAVE